MFSQIIFTISKNYHCSSFHHQEIRNLKTLNQCIFHTALNSAFSNRSLLCSGTEHFQDSEATNPMPGLTIILISTAQQLLLVLKNFVQIFFNFRVFFSFLLFETFTSRIFGKEATDKCSLSFRKFVLHTPCYLSHEELQHKYIIFLKYLVITEGKALSFFMLLLIFLSL